MISEIDLLLNDIPRLEKKFGMDNSCVELLKAQLALFAESKKETATEGSVSSGGCEF